MIWGICCANEKNDGEGAVACFRKLLELDPMNPGLHFMMGRAQHCKGDLDAAIACFRKTAELNPSLWYEHAEVGSTLMRKGRYTEARAVLDRTLELQPADDLQREYTQQLIQERARHEKLESRLDGLLKGAEKTTSARENLDVALICWHKQMHATAVRFAALAYAADPKLGDDLEKGYRYRIAVAAILATVG